MDPNQGNPYMQGANPFMQTPPPPVKGAPQAPDPMAPLDPNGLPDPMGAGTSETTKPRQMPGGAPAPGMPAPGGAPAMDPLGGEPTTDTNVPQPSMDARAKLVAIRREVRKDNPDLSIRDAHEIAMQAVALLKEAASPMGPVTVPKANTPGQQNQQARQPQQRQRVQQPLAQDGLPTNDPRNPRDRRSVLHPEHPSHAQYFGDPKDGLWRSQFGGRNPLQDRANAAGYSGQYQHLYGLGDALLQSGVEKVRQVREQRAQRRGAP